MPATDKNDGQDADVAKLSRRALREITAVMSDIRITVKRLGNLDDSPLAVMDADAVDAIKDLYYVISNEDPLNVQPARRLLLNQKVVESCILPILSAVNSDPAAAENQKRWSVCLYHTFRALSAITYPIPEGNDLLKPGCTLDTLLVDARVALVRTPAAINAVVSLLQYYVERKAEKMARFAPAQESKVEDARIENILVFIKNILSEPRSLPSHRLITKERDIPIHFALIAALYEADLYATLTILFSSRAEARGHLTRLVFVVAEIFRNTFRLSSSREIAAYALSQRHTKVKEEKIEKVEPASETDALAAPNSENPTEVPAPTPPVKSVFDSDYEDEGKKEEEITKQKVQEKPQNRALERRARRAANLRDAIRRERAFVGGSRAVTAGARWTNRFSGQFKVVKKEEKEELSGAKEKPKFVSGSSAVLGGHSAVKKSRSNSETGAQLNNFQLNSDLLCAASGTKMRKMVETRVAHGTREVRVELTKAGRRALADILMEFVDENAFGVLTIELRARIMDLVTKRTAAESEELPVARRAFLSVVGIAVGFQRERTVLLHRPKTRLQIHEGDANEALKADSCPIGAKWLPVESGIELETFKLVFDALLAFGGKGRHHAEDAMLATNALKEMMKMIQCLVVHPEKEEDVQKEWEAIPAQDRPKRVRLTGRDFGLCTLEDLFEREDYLNAPCSLAREFDSRWHSFDHLANVIEVAHAFTSTLRDEKELEKIKVRRKKRKRKKKQKKDEDGKEKEPKADKDQESGENKKKEDTEVKAKENEESNDVMKDKNVNKPVTAFDQALMDIEKEKESDSQDKQSTEGEIAPTVDAVKAEPEKSLAALDVDSTETQEKIEESKNRKDNEGAASAKDAEDLVEQTENGAQKATFSGSENQSEKVEVAATTETKTGDALDATGSKSSEDGEKKKELEEDEHSDSESEVEVEKKVESIGIIRRYAHSRALQILAMPIRACLCKATSLSGGIYAVPDSSRAIAVPLIAAKSMVVLTTIWNTSGGRDKGALRGHFFTFSFLQLISLSMNLKKAEPLSVVGRLAEFGIELVHVLHEWIQINPGLAMEVFLGMDKGTCMQYAHTIHLKKKLMNEADTEKKADCSDYSDAEDAMDEIERRANLAMYEDEDSEDERMAEIRRAKREERRAKVKVITPTSSAKLRRRRQPVAMVEDDDVDDIDALNIGRKHSSEEEEEVPPSMAIDGNDDALLKSTTPRAQRRKKRKTRLSQRLSDEDDDDYSSDSGVDEKRKPRKKRKKSADNLPKRASAQRGKKKPRKMKKTTESELPQVFSSDDEFEEDTLTKYMGPLSTGDDTITAKKADPEASAAKAAALNADIQKWAAVDAESGSIADGMASQSTTDRIARKIVLPSDDESE